MLERIIDFAFKNRLLVVLVVALCIGLGAWRMLHIAVDAFPDTTPVQVQINAVAPALNPAEIEQQITLPLEVAIAGLPGLVNVRSISKFGFAQVVATFDDNTHIYDARQLVMERVGSVGLPPGIERPTLGPIASGLGEVFHYTLSSTSPDRTLDELRTLHDWVIKPELLKVAGVAEINSWGVARQVRPLDRPSLCRARAEQPERWRWSSCSIGRIPPRARRGSCQHSG